MAPPPDISSAFQAALRFHQAGQIAKAQSLYREILKRDPQHFDACHLLGTSLVQQGAAREGIALISRALTVRPEHADAHFNLGHAWRAVGENGKATACFDQAIALSPHDPLYHLEKGALLEAAGQLRAALECYDDVLTLEPQNAAALVRRSSALIKLGRPQEAATGCDTARGLEIRDFDVLLLLGTCLRRLGRAEEAIGIFERAIARQPASADAYQECGRAQLDRAQYQEAAACFDKAISLKPGYWKPHYFRGLLLAKLEYFDLALASIDAAIGLRPHHVDAHVTRGDLLRSLERLDEARASYEEATRLKPDHAPAWFGMARIAADMGRFKEAREDYETVLRHDPASVRALCGIAELKTLEADDPLFAAFETRLARNDVSAEDGARLHHAYAKMCSDAGRHDDAFNHFRTGKSLLSSTFDLERHRAGYAAMKSLFTAPFFAARRNWGLADERPVFVVGMPRSGTTLTEQILASHPRAEGLGELPDLPVLIEERCGPLADGARFTEMVSSLTAAAVAKMAERYLQAYRRADAASLRLIDKRPHNYEWLGLIALMFPKARIVHCRRDALDNCLSMYMQNFAGNHGYNQDLETLGRYYRSYQGLMAHWSGVVPLPMHDFVYETVIADFEPSVRALVSFAGLDWSDECLAYHRLERRVNTPSRWQVRQPLYDSSVGRWRRYEKHLDPLRAGLGLDQEAVAGPELPTMPLRPDRKPTKRQP